MTHDPRLECLCPSLRRKNSSFPAFSSVPSGLKRPETERSAAPENSPALRGLASPAGTVSFPGADELGVPFRTWGHRRDGPGAPPRPSQGQGADRALCCGPARRRGSRGPTEGGGDTSPLPRPQQKRRGMKNTHRPCRPGVTDPQLQPSQTRVPECGGLCSSEQREPPGRWAPASVLPGHVASLLEGSGPGAAFIQLPLSPPHLPATSA